MKWFGFGVLTGIATSLCLLMQRGVRLPISRHRLLVNPELDTDIDSEFVPDIDPKSAKHTLSSPEGRRCSGSQPQNAVKNIDLQRPVLRVSEAEASGKSRCSFVTEHGGHASCRIEQPEHELVQRWLPHDATVLELGARYGTTSCEIAYKTKNSGRLLAVEPDALVWSALEKNRASHNCNFHIHHGLLDSRLNRSTARVSKTEASYATYAKVVGPGESSAVSQEISVLSFEDAQTKYGLCFDTLLIDCEGCILDFLEANPGVMHGIKLILIEGDKGDYDQNKRNNSRVDYNILEKQLQAQGFKVVEHMW
eukprot:CAMPEP_0198535526 /NCGR_PEP_ID=MMETSP1462-20131121/39754_1 /TAXON_ID=1333877 /ORGANISM="Brandtodinium nutriculum, Strain RCC3387" /LENGTH=308 /DNA_ID=CAMNT_0044265465 /DNA_START=107 /DNA_END=1030 /DNA_ORIENTATION=+